MMAVSYESINNELSRALIYSLKTNSAVVNDNRKTWIKPIKIVERIELKNCGNIGFIVSLCCGGWQEKARD